MEQKRPCASGNSRPSPQPSPHRMGRGRDPLLTKVFVDKYEYFRIIAVQLTMKKPKPPKPTDAEMMILRVLWRRGRSTVREVWEQIGSSQGTGYTTVLKTLQIMFEKGLVERNETERSHVYKAARSE